MQIYWNKIKRLHKKGVWLPADWFWDTNMASVSLFWDTNMTAVTSCKNTLYHSEENGKGFVKSFFAKPASQLWNLFFIILFCYFCGFMNSLASYIDLLYFVSVAHMPLINRQWGHYKEISDRDLLDLLAERSTPRPEISFNDRTDKFNKLFIIRPF